MSFYVWNIFFCTFLVVSSVNSQNTGQWNLQQMKTEIINNNVKFSYVIDEIDQIKVNNPVTGQVEQLKGQLSADLKQSTQLNEATKQEMDSMKNEMSIMKKELSELRKKTEIMEMSLHLAKYHEKNWEEREKVFNDVLASVYKELAKLNKSEEILEKLALITKPTLSGLDTPEVDFSWAISMENRNYEENLEVLSEVFALKGYPYGAQAKLKLESGYFYISLCYKDLTGSALNFPIVPSVHYTIKGPKSIHRHYTYAFKAPVQYNDFYYERYVSTWTFKGLDHLTIDIQLESPLESRQAYSHDGRLFGAIHDYKTKRRMEMDSLVLYQLSPYFYTSPTGRRVQAYFRLNGYGDFIGAGIAVTMDFLSGPYDEALSASFPHRTTVTFFNLNEPTKNLVYSVDENIDDHKWYILKIAVTQEDIEKVLHEDTLYYQIDIVPIQISVHTVESANDYSDYAKEDQ